MPRPIVPDDLPDGPAYDAIIATLKGNEIVSGKFLSDDGELALAVLALDRSRRAGARRQEDHRQHQRDPEQGAGAAPASSRI